MRCIFDAEKFSLLCGEDSVLCEHDGDCIGTYSEKRIHRIFKRMVSDDAQNYEVRIGKFVADVAEDGVISEIQTGSFLPLAKKVKFYLENTNFQVRVIAPIVEYKTVIRADKQTGEIIRQKVSPKHERDMDVIAKMYALAEFANDKRFSLYVPHIKADEYRYSEARRYNRQGRYDSDLVPTSLLGVSEFHGKEDYLALFPQSLPCEFGVSDFATAAKLKGRAVYRTLVFYTQCGVLSVEKIKNKNIYRKI